MHTRALKNMVLAIIVIIISIIAIPERAEADAVTDNISVAIGYTGMQLKEYVVVGDYHWSELMNELPVYEQAFSYYQGGDGLKFTEIVDAARGFPLREFLEYAHVYYGDILNLQFYVVDHSGIQAAFDRDVLFQERYYFEDYIGHLKWIRDDDFNVTGYDSSGCWNYREQVEPMLALEDNWMSYAVDPKLQDKNPEHSLPDFDHANPSTRFRLLFGQTNPEETLTSSSAKYVRTVYVTLRGKPHIDDNDEKPVIEIDGKYGTMTVTVTTDTNADIRSAMKDLINFNSTNDEVLVIREIEEPEPDDFFVDKVKIKVRFEIVGEGPASITASYGIGGEAVSGAGTIEILSDDDPGSKDDGTPDGDGSEPSEQSDNDDSGKGKNDSSGKQNSGSSGSKGSGHASGNSSGSRKSSSNSGSGNKSKTTSGSNKQARAQSKANARTNSPTTGKAGGASVYLLSENVRKKLSGEGGDSLPLPDVPVDENVTELKIEDNTEEKEEQARLILILTGAGSAVLAGLGALSESISFSLRLKKGIVK